MSEVTRETSDPSRARVSLQLVLPYPVSANRYWQSFVPRGGTRAITVVSKEAKDYKRHVARLVRDAGVDEPIAGPVEVEIELYPHLPQDWAKRVKRDPAWWDLTVQCLDLDNARKVLYDALKDVAFGDDKLVRKDSGVICPPDGQGDRVVVTVRPYVRAVLQPPQPELFTIPPPATTERADGMPF